MHGTIHGHKQSLGELAAQPQSIANSGDKHHFDSDVNGRNPLGDEEYNGYRGSTTNTAKFRSGAQDIASAVDPEPFSNPETLEAKEQLGGSSTKPSPENQGIIGKAVETIQNFWNPKKEDRSDQPMDMDEDHDIDRQD